MKTLREYIKEAEENKVAVGHFNISDLEGFWAVVNAGKKLNLPVIIGVSEGERDFVGVHQIKALVDSVRKEGQPVFLNADHTYSFERVKEAIDAGFDAAIIDEADKPFAENIEITKKCVDYARSVNPEMIIEGELGFIGKSSQIIDKIPEGAGVSPETETKANEAKEFVEATGIDMFAPSVGNIHGLVKGGEPKINIERIREIKEAVKIPLVLHGGSGIPTDELKEAIQAGISVIHVNTEIRIAYKEGLEESMKESGAELAPYKLMKKPVAMMQEVIEEKLRLFSGLQ